MTRPPNRYRPTDAVSVAEAVFKPATPPSGRACPRAKKRWRSRLERIGVDQARQRSDCTFSRGWAGLAGANQRCAAAGNGLVSRRAPKCSARCAASTASPTPAGLEFNAARQFGRDATALAINLSLRMQPRIPADESESPRPTTALHNRGAVFAPLATRREARSGRRRELAADRCEPSC